MKVIPINVPNKNSQHFQKNVFAVGFQLLNANNRMQMEGVRMIHKDHPNHRKDAPYKEKVRTFLSQLEPSP